jgi:hypothetical protein
MSSVVRSEVLEALDRAEAHGEKRVRVIVGLRGPDSLAAVKRALGRSGAKAVHRESETFLAASLSREEVHKVSQLREHVRAVWLDSPVSAAEH